MLHAPTPRASALNRLRQAPGHLRPPRPARALPLTRRYDVRWCDETGAIQNLNRIAPALPVFEAAFSAFTHGALIATADGPVAVEDLEPGTMVETAAGGQAKLRWIGSITLVPGAPTTGDLPDRLYRVTSDAFGLNRPATDVTLGPAARILNRDARARRAAGCEAALVPVSALVDGHSVIELAPVSMARVYHIVLDGHQVVLANGVEVESYHPGSDMAFSLTTEMRDLFCGLFPHLSGLDAFGRVLWPRVSSDALDTADAY